MKRPLACLIIAGTFTFGTSMIASAAPSVPSSVQTSQSTVQKVRDDYTVCRHGYRHTRSDAGLRAATATQVLVLRSV